MIVPQAIRIVIPPTGNEFITLLKLTSLAFVISLHELLTAAQVRGAATSSIRRPTRAALVYYLVIVSVLMVIQAQLERRFTWTLGRRRRRRGPVVPRRARCPMTDVVLRAEGVHKSLRRARGAARRRRSRSAAAR